MSISDTPAPAAPATNGRREDRNKSRVREMDREVFYRHNFDHMDVLYVPDYIDYDIFPGQAPGLDGFKEAMRVFAQAYPDLHTVLDFMVAEGDMVVVQGFFEGTNTGPFMGVPPSNIKVLSRRCEVIRFNDEGKATERWGVGPELKNLQTMGVIGTLAADEAGQDAGSVANRFSRELFQFSNPAAIADLIDERARADTRGMLALFQFAYGLSDVEAQVREPMSGPRRTATIQVDIAGTHTGPGLGVAGTNQRVGTSITLFVRVSDGKIRELWVDHEPEDLMRQVAPQGQGPQGSQGQR